MSGVVTAAIFMIIYILVVIAYGLRRVREKEARASIIWPDSLTEDSHVV